MNEFRLGKGRTRRGRYGRFFDMTLGIFIYQQFLYFLHAMVEGLRRV